MKTLALFIAMVTALHLKAQQNTCDTNSCLMKRAGDYQTELVLKCSDLLHFYLYDREACALRDTAIAGYLSFYYLDDTYVDEEIHQHPNTNSIEARVAYPGFYNFKISLIINKQTVSAYLDNECTLRANAEDDETNY